MPENPVLETVWCEICEDHKMRTPAVALCNEFEVKRPVCARHKFYCDEEGHGTLELAQMEGA